MSLQNNNVISFLDEELELDHVMETTDDSTQVPVDKDNSEADFATPQVPREKFIFKCKICARMFKSRYAFTVHVNTHQKKCVNCNCVYKTWKDVENHEKFCAKRFGCTVIHARPKRAEKPVKRPFKCQLCNRRYQKYEQLFDHQVQRCKKRYISTKWTVKI